MTPSERIRSLRAAPRRPLWTVERHAYGRALSGAFLEQDGAFVVTADGTRPVDRAIADLLPTVELDLRIDDRII